MKNIHRIGAAVTIAAALTALTGCSGETTPPEAPTTTAPAETPVPEASAPEANAPATDPAITEIGATVPADQIDAARAAGANVYVSPGGDGTGLVVDPDAPLPEQVRADIEALPVYSPDSTVEISGELAQANGMQAMAMQDAGLVAFRMFPSPPRYDGGQDWMVIPLGLTFDDTGGNAALATTREEAIAMATEYFAEWWNPDDLFG